LRHLDRGWRASRLEQGSGVQTLEDLPGEVLHQTTVLFALLKEFAVLLNLLAEIVEFLVEKAGERSLGEGGGGELGQLGTRVWGRELGLGMTGEAAASPFEVCFDIEVLAFPVVAALAERPK